MIKYGLGDTDIGWNLQWTEWPHQHFPINTVALLPIEGSFEWSVPGRSSVPVYSTFSFISLMWQLR